MLAGSIVKRSIFVPMKAPGTNHTEAGSSSSVICVSLKQNCPIRLQFLDILIVFSAVQ